VYLRQVTSEPQRERPEIRTSYHVHSKWSDGVDSIADLVAAAPRHDLDEIGLSDHLVLTPDSLETIRWSLPPDRLDDYMADVRQARDTAKLPVRLGLEVDYFPERIDAAARLLDGREFDYLIGSVHFVGAFPVDEARRFWARLTTEQINDVCREYWRLMARMAQTGLFHLAGHLDLVKKFDFRPTVDLSREIGATLDAIAGSGMAIELNTSGWSKPCHAPYPSEDLLRDAVARGIPVVITSDVHRKADLDRHFDQAVEMLRRLSVTETLRFSGGKAVRAAL
jgi:histidinol-phosphatase (PHP family)